MTEASSRFATAASAGCDSAMVALPNALSSARGASVTAAGPLPPSTGVKVFASTSTTAGCGASSTGSLTVTTVPCSVACSTRAARR